ncbi:MAG: lipopolysaccharide transport periplasmic protein LptA [Desulfurivibrionaceae bacterium]|nr:lipopolysaccharide transport periplasmic protein LptA [Desulfobulbales bacterium]MDT8334224.1 lipopolysaccharide transport periplasmic protein LptA [Desulfurivibrionaceae bacterium]
MSGFKLIVLQIIIAVGGGIIVPVQAGPINNGSPNEPIHIEADRMESDQRTASVTFAGNVEAVQGDMVIRADLMTVHYRKDAAPAAGTGVDGRQSIESLQATGNITIDKEEWRAAGERMDYETEGRKVVLTGNTRVWQGSNVVSGDRVVLYLDEGKSVVEARDQAEGGRVKAFFYPESSETEKTQQPGN